MTLDEELDIKYAVPMRDSFKMTLDIYRSSSPSDRKSMRRSLSWKVHELTKEASTYSDMLHHMMKIETEEKKK
jgi:hypothetical protein